MALPVNRVDGRKENGCKQELHNKVGIRYGRQERTDDNVEKEPDQQVLKPEAKTNNLLYIQDTLKSVSGSG